MTEMVTKEEATRSPAEMRADILRLESVMRTMDTLDLPVKHHFSPGVYCRELFIPKGCTLTGKIHLTEHLNILAQGKISVLTDDGIKTLEAPQVILSKPGIKRVGYAHEDTTWITVHHSFETDPAVIEEKITTTTFDDFIEVDGKLLLKGDQ